MMETNSSVNDCIWGLTNTTLRTIMLSENNTQEREDTVGQHQKGWGRPATVTASLRVVDFASVDVGRTRYPS